MKFSFMHIADIHLGYRQYGLDERSNDFFRAFRNAIQTAIQRKVDFVLLAGDLFHKRSIDALTLNQAFSGLEMLQKAGIPCIAVEGNHELAPFGEELGWLHFLALHGMLTLLRADFNDGQIQLSAFQNNSGSWIDVLPGVRIHGLRYHGAGVREAIKKYADALSQQKVDGIEYSIFMAHTGIEGELAGDVASPSVSEWSVLRPWTDYVALGHIHKNFVAQDWIYNPGSLETVAVNEEEWPERGYWLVEVDTDAPAGERHRATLFATVRRPVLRAIVRVDTLRSADEIKQACIDAAYSEASARYLQPGDAPIVDVLLTGVLSFSSQTLDLDAVNEAVKEKVGALIVQLRNSTRPFEGQGNYGEGLTREELEREVMADLYAADVHYQDRSAEWAASTIALKKEALSGVPNEVVLESLAGLIASAKGEPLPGSSLAESSGADSARADSSRTGVPGAGDSAGDGASDGADTPGEEN